MKNNNLLKTLIKARSDMREFYTDMDLIEVSTLRQIANGTAMYKDTRLKNVYYTFHRSGYFRRRTLTSPCNTHFCGRKFEHYQLNRQHTQNGHVERILVPDRTSQMILAVHAIELYRAKHGVILEHCDTCGWEGPIDELKIVNVDNQYDPEDKSLYEIYVCPECGDEMVILNEHGVI